MLRFLTHATVIDHYSRKHANNETMLKHIHEYKMKWAVCNGKRRPFQTMKDMKELEKRCLDDN